MSIPSSSSLFKPDFETYNNELQSKALNATRLAASLPSDIGFHRSTDADFARALDTCSEKVLLVTNQLLSFAAASRSVSSKSKGKAKITSQDDVVDGFQSLVVDVLDTLLERADTCLDNHLGLSKPHAIEVNPKATKSNSMPKDYRDRQGRLDARLLHAAGIEKPQRMFRKKADNSNSPWQPALRHKYNAKMPLGYNLKSADTNSDVAKDGTVQTAHPYEHEIRHIAYPQRLFERAEIVPTRSFADTPFTWVDTAEALENMLQKLRTCQEVAVDLEHHNYRSYYGFLCLMQISTREEDFIVDTLKLRDELEELNEVFTNPNVTKVFHGADSDIIWLQQNFNLYIVNLFDTYQASRVLEFPRHSLAVLLTMYCDFEPDKRYQLADWRIRPLPDDMLQYARSDTHFLLYIYDSLRNALLDRGNGQSIYIRSVLDLSAQTSLRTYTKDTYDFGTGLGPSGWNTLATKWNKNFSATQMSVFRAVHAWRDRLARQEDESTRYVLPNNYLFQLAEQPPGDMAALLAVFRHVPPLIRTRAKELMDVIRSSREDFQTSTRVALSVSAATNANIERSVTVSPPSVTSYVSVQRTKDNAKLWGIVSPHPIATSVSEFLGVSTTKQTVSYISSRSALFPSLSAPRLSKHLPSSRYLEALSRIHGSLVVAPEAPVALNDVKSQSENYTEEDTQDVEPTNTERLEIPFVPMSQRQSIKTNVEDTLVVVGQQRQKKRKRPKNQADSRSTEVSSHVLGEGNKTKSNSEEPFDYSSAPNILDVETNMTADGPRSKQRRRGPAIGHGNFPAPPKARNEPKSGNQSRTFK